MAGTRWVVMLTQGQYSDRVTVAVAVCHVKATGDDFVAAAQGWADGVRERWQDTLYESEDPDERTRLLKRAFPERRDDGDVPHDLFGWLDPTEDAGYWLAELPSVSAADLKWEARRG